MVLIRRKPQDGTLELQSFSGRLIMSFLQGKRNKNGERNAMVSVNLCRNNRRKYQVEQQYQTKA